MKVTEWKIKDKVYLALVGLFIVLIFVSPSYNHGILNKGIYFHHTDSYNQLKELENKEKIIFFKESPYSSISVTEQKEFFGTEADKPTYFDTLKKLRINGKIQSGTGKFDITTTTLLAALPLSIHKEPKNALNIGLGCGIVQGVLNSYPLQEMDVVEVDSAVIEASNYFNDVHNNALKDSRVNLIVSDARNFLLTTNKKYDIIVSEPSHPWGSPSNILFTKEFFELLKSRLNEDGVVAQWYPSVTSSVESFKVFYNTFSDAFPYVEVFVAKVPKTNYRFLQNGSFEIYYEGFDEGELILIGSKNPIEISEKSALNSELNKYLKTMHFSNVKDYHLASGKELVDFAVNAPINTDNKPILEFLSSQNLYSQNYGRITNQIQDFVKKRQMNEI